MQSTNRLENPSKRLAVLDRLLRRRNCALGACVTSLEKQDRPRELYSCMEMKVFHRDTAARRYLIGVECSCWFRHTLIHRPERDPRWGHVSVLDDWKPAPDPVHLVFGPSGLIAPRVRAFVNCWPCVDDGAP